MLLLECLLPLQANVLQLGALLEDLMDRKGGRKGSGSEGKTEEEREKEVLFGVERSVSRTSQYVTIHAKGNTS